MAVITKNQTAVWMRVVFSAAATLLIGCREQLVHNLSESQANRLITRLHENSIHSEKERQADGQWSVEVDKVQRLEAMREVQKMRLLVSTESRKHESPSMISSRDQQRFVFERSLSAEIERTLSSIDGVLESRVHLNLPQVDPLFGKVSAAGQGSGSVFIITERELSFGLERIAALVAGAAGISSTNISVLIEVDSVQSLQEHDKAPENKPQNQVGIAEVENTRLAVESTPYFMQVKQKAPLVVGLLFILIGIYCVKLLFAQMNMDPSIRN